MKQTTDAPTPVSTEDQKSEFAPGFVRWMVTLTVLTLSFVFLNSFVFERSGFSFISPIPWSTAGGLILQQALTQFSGGHPEVASLAVRLGMLGGLLLAVVLAPTAFFFSWRKLLIGEKKGSVRPANIGFIVGGVVVLFYALSVGFGAILQQKFFGSMQATQALGENRDAMIHELRVISLDAYQYKILPRSLGGGAGSYSGYDIPADMRKSEDASYRIVSVGDSILTLEGASARYNGAAAEAVYGGDGTMKGPFAFRGAFQ